MTRYLMLSILFLLPWSIQAASCEEEYYQQFDFWLGEWDVYANDGKLVGHNSIKKSHGDCVITEHYVAKSGYSGESLNIYDKSTKQWHQTWVDNTGLLLKIAGRWNGQAMIMQGEKLAKGKAKVIHKIKWTKKSSDMVHQEWSISKDKGQHWETLFYGVYKKAASSVQ